MLMTLLLSCFVGTSWLADMGHLLWPLWPPQRNMTEHSRVPLDKHASNVASKHTSQLNAQTHLYALDLVFRSENQSLAWDHGCGNLRMSLSLQSVRHAGR